MCYESAYRTMQCKKWHNFEAEINLLHKPKIVAKSPKITVYLTKLLQLLGDEIPQTPYRGSAPGPRWGTSVPQRGPGAEPR